MRRGFGLVLPLVLALVLALQGHVEAERQPLPGVANGWVVGVPTARFNFRAAPEQAGRQRQQNWCWAACIQMVLNFHGIAVSQEQIVERTFGRLIDAPGQPQQILANLNGWAIDQNNQAVTVRAEPLRFSGRQMVQDLSDEQPLIIGLNFGGAVGHAYVVTALSYIETGGEPRFLNVVLRDPMPGNMSRQEVPWARIVANVTFLARVRVTRTPRPQPRPDPQPQPQPQICRTCQGNGQVGCQGCQAQGAVRCGGCNGAGRGVCAACRGQRAVACVGCGGRGAVLVQDAWGRAVWMPCRGCGGNGAVGCGTCRAQGVLVCQNCRGTGAQACRTCRGQRTIRCNGCNGSGRR